MAARTFEDPSGGHWEVFEVHRTSDKPGAVSAGMEQGWLAFVHGPDKRRLAPIPAGWETASDSQLRAMWARARQASSRPELASRRRAAQGTAGEIAPDAAIAPAPRIESPPSRSWGHREERAPSTGGTERDAVEQAVRAFAQEARLRGIPAVEAMVRLKGLLAERFPGATHIARDRRVVRRWFVETYYFERDA